MNAQQEMPRRGLVTGGAGFIGSTVVDQLLAAGWDVVALDDLSSGKPENLQSAMLAPGFRFEAVDIRSPQLLEILERHRPEVVFHLAAQPSVAVSVREPVADADVNIVGSLRVLEAARQAGVRKVVFAASGGSLYGDVDASKLPISEASAHRPQSPYGLSKKTVVDYLALYEQLYGLAYTALALANVYGPRQDPHGEAGVVASFANDLHLGRPRRIDGDGGQTRDFVYVDDVARAFLLAADRADGVLLNIGTGEQVSINRLHLLMSEAADRAVASEYAPGRPTDVRFSALDPTLASTLLGWKAEVAVVEGLRRTIRWVIDAASVDGSPTAP